MPVYTYAVEGTTMTARVCIIRDDVCMHAMLRHLLEIGLDEHFSEPISQQYFAGPIVTSLPEPLCRPRDMQE